jgi:hypothetical protein
MRRIGGQHRFAPHAPALAHPLGRVLNGAGNDLTYNGVASVTENINVIASPTANQGQVSIPGVALWSFTNVPIVYVNGQTADAGYPRRGLWSTAPTSGGGGHLWAVDCWQQGPQIGGGAFAFSPDSKLMAVETGYGVVRLVAPDTGQEYAQLEDPNQDRVGDGISFTPDSTQLVTTNNDSHSIHVWNLRTIRQQLAKLGLDWDLPPYPTALEVKKPQPLRIQVELGDLNGPGRPEIARQVIEQKRRALGANPNSARACNDLAWTYLTAPEALRDWKAALPLAEKAVQLDANAMYRNTLGLAYYRADRYREAVEALQPNLKDQVDWALTYDLYFLAMSHHQLGDSARAREFYDLAVRWSGAHGEALAPFEAELTAFHAEAQELLKIDKKALPK